MNQKITQIDVQGFQSWLRGKIVLNDFTVLVGQSSSGKTALFRLLDWVFNGTWDGTYPSEVDKATCGGFTLTNGIRVLRLRKGNENKAAVAKDGETVKYKAFGATIPGIHSIFNVKPIEVGNETINLNLSMQDDPCFMVLESRPVKAQFIGRLYGAHIINEMLRAMAKDKKAAESKRKDSAERLLTLEAELKTYDTLEAQENLFMQAKAQLKEYQMLTKLVQYTNLLATNKAALARDMWVTKVDTKRIRAAIDTLAALKLLAKELDTLADHKVYVKSCVKLLGVDTAGIRAELDTLEVLTATHADISRLRTENRRNQVQGQAAALQASVLRSKLEGAILAGGMCPACSRPISGDSKQVIANVGRLMGVGV